MAELDASRADSEICVGGCDGDGFVALIISSKYKPRESVEGAVQTSINFSNCFATSVNNFSRLILLGSIR